METILHVKNLVTEIVTAKGKLRAVNDVSFSLSKGETMAIVGESGAGKSMIASSIMRLIPPEQGRIAAGEIWLGGVDLCRLSEKSMANIRGNKIAMIFQEPMNSLNPVLTIGYQIAEVLTLHKKMSLKQAKEKAIALLARVGINEPAHRINNYPHQLSGGMRQRVMIAMALACEPQLLIADEPTTALDVTIQAQILTLLAELQQEMGMAILFITHDLAIVSQIAEQVAVMYAGKFVEQAPSQSLFIKPMHPYTVGLLNAMPRFSLDGKAKQPLYTIKGMVPSFFDLPVGCSFQNRCEFATAACQQEPVLTLQAVNHRVACFHPRNQSNSNNTKQNK